MKMNESIFGLVDYAVRCELIEEDDLLRALNRLLEVMGLDGVEPATASGAPLHVLLETLTEDAVARGVCEDNQVARDLFDTTLMGVLTPRPSIVRSYFEERYESEGPQAATDWFYKFSQDTDYIRRYRIKRDLKWVTKTPYGDLDITINLSKPEKDPKAIAAAKLTPQSPYPKCQLCAKNES